MTDNPPRAWPLGARRGDPSMSFLWSAADRLSKSAIFSYGLILALQSKVIWGIWNYRDLTAGDTSSYFSGAFRWADSLYANLIWSPLYTSFYGTLYALLNDAYAATIWHRAIIAVLSTLGVLAVTRRMLPAALALLIAVWWAVLPVNFDVLYEVHLFAFLPILAAWLLAMQADAASSRGAALAMLVLAAMLVRNEFSVACLLYALYCAWREIGDARSVEGAGHASIARVLPKYIRPMAATAAACLFFFWRTPYSIDTMRDLFRAKHVVNMCQVYAVGYGQRHPEWTENSWIDCQGLMARTFGQEFPSLWQMAASNLPALLEHFAWNVSLTISGLQIALFNAASGLVNPDFVPVHLGESYPFWLSVLALAVMASAVLIASVNRGAIRSVRFRAASYRWAILVAVAATALPVILAERPRPEYLFPLTFLIMLVLGTGIDVLTDRWPRVIQATALGIAAGALLLVPPYYPTHATGRPIRAGYERLRPYRDLLVSQPGAMILGINAGDVWSYLGLSQRGGAILDYSAVSASDPSTDLCGRIDCRGVSAILISPQLRQQWQPSFAARGFCPKDPDGRQWMAIGTPAENDNGILLVRQSDGAPLPKRFTAVNCQQLQLQKP